MLAVVLLQASCGYSEYKVSVLTPNRQANPARQETHDVHDRFAKEMAQTAEFDFPYPDRTNPFQATLTDVSVQVSLDSLKLSGFVQVKDVKAVFTNGTRTFLLGPGNLVGTSTITSIEPPRVFLHNPDTNQHWEMTLDEDTTKDAATESADEV